MTEEGDRKLVCESAFNLFWYFAFLFPSKVQTLEEAWTSLVV